MKSKQINLPLAYFIIFAILCLSGCQNLPCFLIKNLDDQNFYLEENKCLKNNLKRSPILPFWPLAHYSYLSNSSLNGLDDYAWGEFLRYIDMVNDFSHIYKIQKFDNSLKVAIYFSVSIRHLIKINNLNTYHGCGNQTKKLKVLNNNNKNNNKVLILQNTRRRIDLCLKKTIETLYRTKHGKNYNSEIEILLDIPHLNKRIKTEGYVKINTSCSLFEITVLFSKNLVTESDILCHESTEENKGLNSGKSLRH